MQKLSEAPYIGYIKADRQWKRSHRLHHAEMKFKFAKGAHDQEQVAFYREVLKANAYGYEDKILNGVRKEAQREQDLKDEASSS